ncbi:TraR/DksA C4-type zinc finger protein [Allobranchiibius sp. GilTou73]|uniref:TraR/DksA family transcriptional regulator n=1 Tax=Allobranchiibius sp. GilTou73 TaxID=2904523 RepID=UPI001F48A593|nr:TraR/DksA C4-type zinc finger protein [Allobranchiibius sp. GilTou73]UIJ33549.1 TraR/DksA C4-type zinc finger protein [Allobranchiibius sp. GilTou73]
MKSTPTSSTMKDAAEHTSVQASTPAPKSAVTSPRKQLKVREDESPWTADELAGVKAELETDVARLGSELAGIEHEIADLIGDSGDGAGDDQADAGSKSFEREHEFSLAQNSREMLEQSQHALDRIADGTYGICESCGKPIGKLRLQAFPRATLCMQCKQKQERR